MANVSLDAIQKLKGAMGSLRGGCRPSAAGVGASSGRRFGSVRSVDART